MNWKELSSERSQLGFKALLKIVLKAQPRVAAYACDRILEFSVALESI
jgi:hypothetical protein